MARAFLELGQWQDFSHLPHRRPCRGSCTTLLDGTVVGLWVRGTRVSQWKQAQPLHVASEGRWVMHE